MGETLVQLRMQRDLSLARCTYARSYRHLQHYHQSCESTAEEHFIDWNRFCRVCHDCRDEV